jgi:hypothetical protein
LTATVARERSATGGMRKIVVFGIVQTVLAGSVHAGVEARIQEFALLGLEGTVAHGTGYARPGTEIAFVGVFLETVYSLEM